MFAILKLYKRKYKYELVDFNNDFNSLMDKFIEVAHPMSIIVMNNKREYWRNIKESTNRLGFCMVDGRSEDQCMILIMNISYLMVNDKVVQGYRTSHIDRYYAINDIAKETMIEIRDLIIDKTIDDPFYIK